MRPENRMRRDRRPATKALTLGDRLDYGCIAAFAGLVIGLGAALAILFLVGSSSWGVVAFSLVYFFAIGFVRGPDAGDFAGDALSLVTGAGAAAADGGLDGLETPKGRTAIVLVLVYVAGVVLLALWR